MICGIVCMCKKCVKSLSSVQQIIKHCDVKFYLKRDRSLDHLSLVLGLCTGEQADLRKTCKGIGTDLHKILVGMIWDIGLYTTAFLDLHPQIFYVILH